ncbi:serine hydrolase [Hymenobacter sediminicola]|uniref:Serine hydrolase n=1 Tax=Hymenobacter sediminicola TaxID=2761579 RepID=A0A7G7W5M7_9BACT|nr:serine hydrolase [Hymenobacter sediminicola]QNH61670.1 serine hydrolase [Hymenobacter sediminicola]
MKQLLRFLLLSLLVAARPAHSQQTLYFPPATGSTWASTAPQALGWCQPQLDSLLNFLGRKGTKSFIVLKDGRMVVERYYGTYTQDSIWYWASAGKSLTAMLVGIAQQDGLLSLQDSTTRYLGRGWTTAPAVKERLITVQNQLTMTSGLDDTPPTPCNNESQTPNCLLYRADAGTRWAYHTGPYRLLQDVLATASGLTINQYTNQRLASRIGMSGAWVNDVYYSRARDMARFGLLTLARGNWNGTAVLRDTAYFRRMTTPSQPMATIECRPLAAAHPASQKVTLYPNPTAESVTVGLLPGSSQLRLLDALGRPVQHWPAAQTTLSVAELRSGMYLLQWLDTQGSVLASKQLLKQ